MPSNQGVISVMLANGRPAMVARAIQCWRNQTHRSRLLILDTGAERAVDIKPETGKLEYIHKPGWAGSVGSLRNWVNGLACSWGASVIVHWDSDDWSSPRRIGEQVQSMVMGGADAAGYSNGLFWDTRKPQGGGIYGAFERGEITERGGSAWLYTAESMDPTGVIGASLVYRVEAWRAHPFADTSQGEELVLTQAVKGLWLPSLAGGSAAEPRMVFGIHGGNTSNGYDPERMARSPEWRRAKEWDRFCWEVMA